MARVLYEQKHLAKILGVGSSAVSNWKKRGSGPVLPEPEYVTSAGKPLYTYEQLEAVVADRMAILEGLLKETTE